MFRQEPVDTKRMVEGPSAPGFPAPLLERQGSAGMRRREKGYEGGTDPILPPTWGSSQPSSTYQKFSKAQKSIKMVQASLEGPALALVSRTGLACSLSH